MDYRPLESTPALDDAVAHNDKHDSYVMGAVRGCMSETKPGHPFLREMGNPKVLRLASSKPQRRELSARLLRGGSKPALQRLLLGHVDAGFHLPVELALRAVVEPGFLVDPDINDRRRSHARCLQLR